jgi:hypothetical protein
MIDAMVPLFPPASMDCWPRKPEFGGARGA